MLGCADQPTRQRPRFNPSALVKFPELRHRLLDNPPADAYAAHQTPITADLPVLLANRMAQIHAPSKPAPPLKKMPKVGTTRSIQPREPSNQLIRFMPNSAKSQKPPPSCASWAKERSFPDHVSNGPNRSKREVRRRKTVAFGTLRGQQFRMASARRQVLRQYPDRLVF